ncbi:MAG: hypothetical protein HOV66_29035 [Streptomycetaceae bacterium]|nr:hypothetical protein [Streptomycetaceae bacterium]
MQFAAVPAPGQGDSSMPYRFRTAAVLSDENWKQVLDQRPPSRAQNEIDKLRDDLAAGWGSAGGTLGNARAGMSAVAHPMGGPAYAAHAAGMTRAPDGPGDGHRY